MIILKMHGADSQAKHKSDDCQLANTALYARAGHGRCPDASRKHLTHFTDLLDSHLSKGSGNGLGDSDGHVLDSNGGKARGCAHAHFHTSNGLEQHTLAVSAPDFWL